MRRAVIAIAVASGCAPRLSELVDDHHYREAVCAAHDGGSEERSVVTRAIARDARAQLHVEIVHATHLERVLGPDDPVSAVGRFARVRLQIDAIPVDDLVATIALRDANGGVAAVPVDWTVLAALTGETLPPAVTYSTYLHAGTFWRALGAVFSLGMSLPFTTFREREVSVQAPDEHYRARAPRAHALFHAMPAGGCTLARSRLGTASKGLSCEWFVAIVATPSRLVHLDVTLTYSAKRARGDAECAVAGRSTIALGRVDDLALAVSRRFGARTRPLAP
jgi:hypothetical protein